MNGKFMKKIFYIIILWLLILTINTILLITLPINANLIISIILAFIGMDITQKIFNYK